MKIGLTYDLKSEYAKEGYRDEEIAELDRDDTIDAIERVLAGLGHRVSRVGRAERLVERLAAGDRWDLVFNIAEGIRGTARESQVPAILDVYGIPYTFSDPLVLAVGLDKALAKHVVRAAGLPTADFSVIRALDDLASVDLPFPLFIKPIAEGTSKGIGPASQVRSREALYTGARDLLERFCQPVLVERFLEGREFTVGVVGTGDHAEVIGTLEVVLLPDAEAEIYSYNNKQEWEGRVEYRLVNGSDNEVRMAEKLATAAWRAIGCRDGGRVDVRSDNRGVPHFIEVNPLAGLNPEISDLAILCRKAGIDYSDLIARIVASAELRLKREA